MVGFQLDDSNSATAKNEGSSQGLMPFHPRDAKKKCVETEKDMEKKWAVSPLHKSDSLGMGDWSYPLSISLS